MRRDSANLQEPVFSKRTAFPGPRAASYVIIDESGLHRQVLDIIDDVLSTSGPRSGVRIHLLRHLAENPDCPLQAMLDHLRDQGYPER
ncbi:hypothetical protein V3C33_02130 [Micrococcaceae bacterium Sec5.7]